jgi:hypothetical protein
MTPPSRLGLSLDEGHELCDLALVSDALLVGREYLGKQFRERCAFLRSIHMMPSV